MVNELIFRAIFGVEYLIFFGSIVWVRIASMPPKDSNAQHKKGAHIFTRAILSAQRTHPSITAVWPMLLLAPFWYAGWLSYIFHPSWIAFLSIRLPPWFRLIMATTAAAGLLFGVWSYKALGKNWVHALEPTQFMRKRKQELVTTGPYRYTRNPIYCGAFTLLLASALEAANWLILLPVIFMVATVYRQIDGEEKMLIKKFGRKYLKYMKRTPRLIPFIK